MKSYAVKFEDLKDKWYKKGIKAGKQDGWMEPLVNEIDAHDFAEYKDIELATNHNELWEQTDHFQVFYGKPMREDAEKFLEEKGKEFDGEDIYNIAYELAEEFWEGWMKSTNLYGKIKKEREKRGKAA